MKICPRCAGEFLDHIETCVECNERLLDEFSELHKIKSDALLSKEELLRDETMPLVEGSLPHCREIEKVLIKSKISCAVYPVSLACDSNASTLGSSCDMKYMLLVRVNDIDLAKKSLEGKFLEQIQKEGQGKFVADAVDLSLEVITCPACGETNALKDGECPICGLCLAIIDPGQKSC